MTHHLLGPDGALAPMSEEKSKVWFHFFVSAAYFTPLLGAVLSDAFLGLFSTVIIFSLVYLGGLLTLTFSHTQTGLAVALALIATGSGAIKPCVTANVGNQFGKTNKHLMAKVYSWFYWSINLGAVVSNLLVPKLLARYGPSVAFGVPAALMFVATMAFWLGRWEFVHIPRAGIGFVKECFCGEGLRALLRLAVIYLFVAPFWAIFDQMDSAWVLLAEQLNRHWLWYDWESSQIVAANPFLILILIPTFSYVIYPAINRVFPLTPLRKIGIGLLLAGSPFVISALIEYRIAAGAAPSIAWMLLAYVLLTSAEILVSITALEFSYTQAPKKMKSFVMAVFFLSISLGNTFTAIVNHVIENPDGTSKLAGANYYWFFVAVMVVTAILFIPVAMRYPVKEYIQDEAPSESEQ
jgi:POT family proton-dependent oligopeptide transporter